MPNEFDLSATLISLPKYLTSTTTLYSHPTTEDSQEGGTLAKELVENRNWSWEAPNTNERQVLHNPSYTGCTESGHIWVDSMNFEQTGCYSTPELAKLFGAWNGDLINMNNHGVDFSRLDWKNADLDFYRKNGLCLRSKKP
jgi:hypothetical protein